MDLQNIGRVVIENDIRTDGEIPERCHVLNPNVPGRDETQCVVELDDVTGGVPVDDRLFKRRLNVREPPAVSVKLAGCHISFHEHVPNVCPKRGGVRENDHLIGIRLDGRHGLEIGHEVRQKTPIAVVEATVCIPCDIERDVLILDGHSVRIFLSTEIGVYDAELVRNLIVIHGGV